MLNKFLATATAAIMTLSVFTGTVSAMNFAAADYSQQQIQA